MSNNGRDFMAVQGQGYEEATQQNPESGEASAEKPKSPQDGDYPRSYKPEALQAPQIEGPSCSFKSSSKCYDVAVAADGHLVLAVGNVGIKVYDTAGKELSSWRPQKSSAGKNEWIYTVDALPDGRIAVGLDESKCVALLKQDSGQWTEDRRIQLTSPPYHVAVHESLVAAICDSEQVSQVWCAGMASVHTVDPGSMLYLTSADAGASNPLKHTLDYKAFNLALTASEVIVLSLEKQELRDGSHQFVADSYSHKGKLLWRHASVDQMNDVCAASSGLVLYVALRGAKKVRALSNRDGSSLGDVLSDGQLAQQPIALALSERQQPPFIALLSADWCTVTLFPASSSL